MLTIRLQRVGKRNQPEFRIVLAEKHKAVKKKALEVLGYYNPRTKEFNVNDEERVKYWLGQNVETSPTVHNLFVDKGLVSDEKVQAWRPKKKPPAGEEPVEAADKAETAEADEPESDQGGQEDKAEKVPKEKAQPAAGQEEKPEKAGETAEADEQKTEPEAPDEKREQLKADADKTETAEKDQAGS